MSFDLKLARKCDHRLFRQIRFFESDRRTVRFSVPMGSTQNFEVWLNGNLAASDSLEQGWDLVKDEVSLDPGQRKLYFRKARKATDDWVEISYYASPRQCPKCGGFDLQYDYEYSNIGRPYEVRNEQKLAQDMEKAVLTIRGSSIYYPWYGTLLVTYLGSKQPRSGMRLRMQREVADVLDDLKSLQEKQETFQTVADREFLYQVTGVSIVDTADPTLFRVYVRAQTQAGGEANFQRPLRFAQGYLDEQQLLSQRTAF